LQFVLETLGPAANRQIYSSVQDVPLSLSMPEPVEAPVNSAGVQELTLVVSPQGYSPVHFAVKKGIPVRLSFRQLGQVGCGNELIFQWGSRESKTLILDSPADQETLEFTPAQAGEFRFNCPHLIYRGLMTVTE
jgi:plastocyanin domain-containing protein